MKVVDKCALCGGAVQARKWENLKPRITHMRCLEKEIKRKHKK